jgi:hypothetical protein
MDKVLIFQADIRVACKVCQAKQFMYNVFRLLLHIRVFETLTRAKWFSLLAIGPGFKVPNKY